MCEVLSSCVLEAMHELRETSSKSSALKNVIAGLYRFSAYNSSLFFGSYGSLRAPPVIQIIASISVTVLCESGIKPFWEGEVQLRTNEKEEQ